MTANVNNENDFSKQPLTEEEKVEIQVMLQEEIVKVGNASLIASKCGVSPATISQIEKGKYLTQGDGMYLRIAHELGWRRNVWHIVGDTTNTRIVTSALENAQRECLFLAISERAGSGKSSGITKYLESPHANNVFYLECWKWGVKEFLTHIRTIIGKPAASREYLTVNQMLEEVIYYFKTRKGRPLLIIDQANSLPHSSLTILIHIYNQLKGRIGCVMCGTENLQQKITRGVKNRHEGYDEIDSRFGRSYVYLIGYNWNDVRKICSANGVKDEATQKKIWEECRPVNKIPPGGNATHQQRVVEDGRVIERKIFKYAALLNQAKESLTAQTA